MWLQIGINVREVTKKTVLMADAKKTYKDVRKKPLQSHDETKSQTQISSVERLLRVEGLPNETSNARARDQASAFKDIWGHNNWSKKHPARNQARNSKTYAAYAFIR